MFKFTRRALSLALTLAITLSTVIFATLSALAAVTPNDVTAIAIKIPGCNASFALEDVSMQYGIANKNGLLEYRFSFPGGSGKLNCDSPADIEYGQVWEDVNPQNSGIGGGEDSKAAGWSEGYPTRWFELDGKGLASVELTVYDDGTLVGGSNKAVWAYISFSFGYAVSHPNGYGQYPNDLISWEWQDGKIAYITLEYHPISDLHSPVTVPESIPSSWAQAAVGRAKENNLDTIELTNNYQGTTTRLEFCRAAVNFLHAYGYDVDSVTPKLFADTSDIDVGIAAALGITSGTDTAKNLFSPDGTLTREQAATMLRNVMNVLGITAQTSGVAWTDAKDISSWAKETSDIMYSAKIMGGTSTTALVFSPKTPYTHEQSLITLANLWDYVKNETPVATPNPASTPKPDRDQYYYYSRYANKEEQAELIKMCVDKITPYLDYAHELGYSVSELFQTDITEVERSDVYGTKVYNTTFKLWYRLYSPLNAEILMYAGVNSQRPDDVFGVYDYNPQIGFLYIVDNQYEWTAHTSILESELGIHHDDIQGFIDYFATHFSYR